MTGSGSLSKRGIILLPVAGAIVTANAYYIHPIIGPVADTFGVGDGPVGIVPAANQIALALGVLLLLPLGDRFSNRKLVALFLALQVFALVGMAAFGSFTGFVLVSSVLGFFTITPYLLPTYASKRVRPEQLGFVTAILTVGVVTGVQVARVGSGVVAELYGWRSVYWIAAVLMTVSAVALPMMMDEDDRATKAEETYRQLMASMLTITRGHPDVLLSSVIQGLSFSIFLTVWMGIGLHLTSDTLQLGTDVVGYLSAFSMISLVTTPRLGKWADRQGAEHARMKMAIIQLLGLVTLLLVHVSWWWLLITIVVMSFAGPMVDVAGRMVGLRKEAGIRTRLMTVYITLMFVGGSIGSWSGTYAYALGGWTGTVAWSLVQSLLVCWLCWGALHWRWYLALTGSDRHQPL